MRKTLKEKKIVFFVKGKIFKEKSMITNMMGKTNLVKLSEAEVVELSMFIGSIAERFKYMTKTVEKINQRTDKFIKDFYEKERGAVSSEYYRRD